MRKKNFRNHSQQLVFDSYLLLLSVNMIIGHKKQIKYLNNILKGKDSLPHAFLFLGVDKIGKKKVALEFIKAIQCESGEKIGELCNKCAACSQQDKASADFLLIEPDKDSDDNIKEIGIGKIRTLKEFIGGHPVINRFKIAVIDMADLMTHEAQNALLKVLEEPKGDKVIFLISSNVDSILETILSRVYLIKFNLVSKDEISQILDSVPKKDMKDIERMIRIGNFRPGIIYDYLDDPKLQGEYDDIINGFIEFAGSDLNDRFKYIEKSSRSKNFDLKKIMDIWAVILRQALFQKAQVYDLMDNSELENSLTDFIKKREMKDIAESLCLAQEIGFLGFSTNMNQRLAFEVFALAL